MFQSQQKTAKEMPFCPCQLTKRFQAGCWLGLAGFSQAAGAKWGAITYPVWGYLRLGWAFDICHWAAV
jgi:hypothetical protein